MNGASDGNKRSDTSPQRTALTPEMSQASTGPTTIFKDFILPDFIIKVKDVGYVGKPRISEPFYMMITLKSEKPSKFYLEAHDGQIYMRQTETGPYVAYIDINYARIKLQKSVVVAGHTLHGIRFVKNKIYEEIFHPNLAVVEKWFHYLKKYCVLSRFREYYNLGDMLGKGNFAKVYIATKVGEETLHAVKIFDKKLILQDRFERVHSDLHRTVCFTRFE